jgi:nicotinamide mononucleotide transporter
VESLFDSVLVGFGAIPAAEWVAVALAFGYLLLAVRQNPWCWALAIASALIYLVLFAQGGLRMQAALQVFYVAMAAYGWRSWRGGPEEGGAALAVSAWPLRRHALAIGAIVAAAVANGWLMRSSAAGLVPYVDALVAWGSVYATWLVARKVLENWLYWIVLDAIAIGLYWHQGFHATAVLFAVYVVIAVRGYFAWRKELVESAAPARHRAATG